MSVIDAMLARAKKLLTLKDDVADAKILSARILINQLKNSPPLDDLRRAEFKVFSQFGDDGIIQYLVQKMRLSQAEHCFIEFGVENYEESNTRFLLVNDNWKGLVIDAESKNVRHIMNDRIYWRHDLTALCAFITAENIDDLISSTGFGGEIGLLSIDIDGNDYWIWERMHCVNPVLVVVEYNSAFGSQHAVTVPYDPAFQRSAAHFSHLYWGCSIGALEMLARRKGYALVGSNSAGNNAYFVRRDRLSDLRELSASEAYVESRFRESRNRRGALTFLSGEHRLHTIRDMAVFDLRRNEKLQIRALYRC